MVLKSAHSLLLDKITKEFHCSRTFSKLYVKNSNRLHIMYTQTGNQLSGIDKMLTTDMRMNFEHHLRSSIGKYDDRYRMAGDISVRGSEECSVDML